MKLKLSHEKLKIETTMSITSKLIDKINPSDHEDFFIYRLNIYKNSQYYLPLKDSKNKLNSFLKSII